MKFSLEFPIKRGVIFKEDVAELTLRRLSGRDLTAIAREKRSPNGDHLRLMVSLISSLTVREVDELDACDVLRLGEVGAAMMEGKALPHIKAA